MKPLPLFVYTLLALGLSSCTSTRVNSWMDPAFEGRKAGKTMVLGVAESDSLSRQYEAFFVERLTELGTEAQSAHARLQFKERISEAELVRQLQDHGFASIIVTRLLSETERQQVVQTGIYPSHYGNYWGYYSHAYSRNYNTAHIQSYMEVELETNLYDVKTRKLVWSGRTVVYNDRSDLSNMKNIIKGVIKDLNRRELL
jgi:hypothetical protein